jgi:hypothetical protein
MINCVLLQNDYYITHAALVIRGLGIRGFDYSRAGKPGKTANSE